MAKAWTDAKGDEGPRKNRPGRRKAPRIGKHFKARADKAGGKIPKDAVVRVEAEDSQSVIVTYTEEAPMVQDDGRFGRQMTRRTLRMTPAAFDKDFGGTTESLADSTEGTDNA